MSTHAPLPLPQRCAPQSTHLPVRKQLSCRRSSDQTRQPAWHPRPRICADSGLREIAGPCPRGRAPARPRVPSAQLGSVPRTRRCNRSFIGLTGDSPQGMQALRHQIRRRFGRLSPRQLNIVPCDRLSLCTGGYVPSSTPRNPLYILSCQEPVK